MSEVKKVVLGEESYSFAMGWAQEEVEQCSWALVQHGQQVAMG